MRSGFIPLCISSRKLPSNKGVWKAASGCTVCSRSSNAALSRTERVSTKSMDAPCHWRPTPGPTGVRPRVGFNPNKPVNEAGMRMEPPPSLAPAKGTTPEATAAAEPPLDPPGEQAGFHGFREDPYSSGSVIFFSPNSGVLVCPRKRKPASRNLATRWESRRATWEDNKRAPAVNFSPATAWEMSFSRIGTPAKGCWERLSCSISRNTFSRLVRTTACNRGSTSSSRAKAASTNSLGDTSLFLIFSAKAVASYEIYSDGFIYRPSLSVL